MRCAFCYGPFPNEARYINSMGIYACGVCDAQNSSTSIKLTDVPELLRLLDAVMRGQPRIGNAFDQLKELVCLKKI